MPNNTYMKHALLLTTLLMYFLLSIKTSTVYCVYKYTGENGEIVYSDRPAPSKKPTAPKTPPNANDRPPVYSPVPFSDGEQRIIRAKAPPPPETAKPKAALPEVILYTAPWCGYCRQAQAYLANRGIVYRNIDIESSDGSLSFAKVSNGGGIPLLIYGSRRTQGFSQATYDNFFSSKQ